MEDIQINSDLIEQLIEISKAKVASRKSCQIHSLNSLGAGIKT